MTRAENHVDSSRWYWLRLPSCASFRQLRCGVLDCFADARVGSATANVAAHRLVNVLVRGFRRVFKQRNGSHDLTALAVTALHDVRFHPVVLHSAAHGVLTDAFDGHDR